MILPLPPRPLNDNHQDEVHACPSCGNLGFILQSAAGETILVKCGRCFLDCTTAVARQLPAFKDPPCQP